MPARLNVNVEPLNVESPVLSAPRLQKGGFSPRLMAVELEKPEQMPWPKLRHFFTHCSADERQLTAEALLKNTRGALALADLHRAALIDLHHFSPESLGDLTALQWYCQVIPATENWKMGLGDFPSFRALYTHHLSVIQALLSAGLNINAQGHSEPSPLEMSLLSGASSALVSALLASGANPVELCRDPLHNLSQTQAAVSAWPAAARLADNCLSLACRVASPEVVTLLSDSALKHLKGDVYEKQGVMNALVQVAFSENRLELFKRAFSIASGFKHIALLRRCGLANAGLMGPQAMTELMVLRSSLMSDKAFVRGFHFLQKKAHLSLLDDVAHACLVCSGLKELPLLLLARLKGSGLNAASCGFDVSSPALVAQATLAASEIFSRVVKQALRRQQFDHLTLLLSTSGLMASVPLSLEVLPLKTLQEGLVSMMQTSQVQARTVLLMLREKVAVSQGLLDEKGRFQTPAWFNQRLSQLSGTLVKTTVPKTVWSRRFFGLKRFWGEFP